MGGWVGGRAGVNEWMVGVCECVRVGAGAAWASAPPLPPSGSLTGQHAHDAHEALVPLVHQRAAHSVGGAAQALVRPGHAGVGKCLVQGGVVLLLWS